MKWKFTQNQKKCSSTALRITKLRFTWNKQKILVNISVILFHKYGTHTFLERQLWRTLLLEAQCATDLWHICPVQVTQLQERKVEWTFLTTDGEWHKKSSSCSVMGIWIEESATMELCYPENTQVCCFSEGHTKKTRLFIPDEWYKDEGQGPASKKSLIVLIQAPIREKITKILTDSNNCWC